MNPKELIEATKNSPTVAFHKFVLLTRNRETDLFCFFEGNDSIYYSSRIKNLVEVEYHPISCGNKKAVLGVHELLTRNETYTKYKKAFFVDRDFDPPINNEEIYETPCYSVENFYVNTHTIKEILKNEFKLTEADSSFKLAIELFERELAQFNNATLLFNSWYATLKEKLGDKSINVSLDDKLPKDFVCVKIGSIKSQYQLEDIQNHFKDALRITEKDVQSKCVFFAERDLTKCLRGKFQFWFLYEFLNYLIEDSNSNNKIISIKTKFNINKGQMISQLSQYALTTMCLKDYLKRFN